MKKFLIFQILKFRLILNNNLKILEQYKLYNI